MPMKPPSFSQLTKVEGDPLRHIEQLWDEVKKLKERIGVLERNSCDCRCRICCKGKIKIERKD